MELIISLLISLAILISVTVFIANRASELGLRWGQFFLLGITLSPLISALIVLMYVAYKKLKLVFLK